MKKFKEELYKILWRLQSNKSFAFVKAADGEEAIMMNEPVNNGEFHFIPGEHEFYRQKLIDSLQFKHKDYFCGVNCICCQGEKSQRMIERSGQDDEHLTFCNVFVNSNYEDYVNLFIPEYSKRKVYLVANENSKVDKLPFKIEKFYPVGNTAFVNNYSLIQQIKDENHNDVLYLFAAGPWGNVAAYEIFKDNQSNTILDIGSTLNPWLESEGFKRDYYYNQNSMFSQRTCVWS